MSIKDNITVIQNNLPEHVKLIAVSKTRDLEEIREAYDTGVRDFGENKVQEFMRKHEELPNDIRWHIIGHLQKNKVKYIIGKVELIHSLDSIDLLKEIEKQCKARNSIVNVLIQINIGKENSKSGIYLEDLNCIIEACESCDNVKVKGLMAIIPKGNEEVCRTYFNEMNAIYNSLKKKSFKNIAMEVLSMGMSGDYEIAIEQGSNMVRVGEGIFGRRIYNNNKEEK